MASWLDKYAPASFRKVPFFVRAATHTGGRRLVKHEYPERDDADFEDQGRINPDFPITGYLIGDDYFDQRKKLIEAFETKGTGTLIHPYRGSKEVYAGPYSTEEIEDEGRMLRFTVTFHWKTDKKLAFKGPSAVENLYQKRESFLEAAVAFLEDVYDVASQPAAALHDAIDVANSALDVVEAAKRVTGTIDEFKAKLDALRGKFQQATLLLSAIGQDFMELIAFGTDVKDVSYSVAIGDAATEQFNELRTVTEVQDATLSKFPSKAVNGFASYEIQKHVTRVGACAQAGLLGTMTLDNSRQADAVLKTVNDQIDLIEEDETISDDFYEAARDLRVAAADVIAERKLTLSRLAVVKLSETESALAASYRLYGTTDRDLEIADLNEILHPGFVPGIIDLDLQVE